jgi:hypothetical protein
MGLDAHCDGLVGHARSLHREHSLDQWHHVIRPPTRRRTRNGSLRVAQVEYPSPTTVGLAPAHDPYETTLRRD